MTPIARERTSAVTHGGDGTESFELQQGESGRFVSDACDLTDECCQCVAKTSGRCVIAEFYYARALSVRACRYRRPAALMTVRVLRMYDGGEP